MSSSEPEGRYDTFQAVSKIYTAESVDSLLASVSCYLEDNGISPRFAIAFPATEKQEVLITHCIHSDFVANQSLSLLQEDDGSYTVERQSTDNLPVNVAMMHRHRALPFYNSHELYGYLILDHHVRDTALSTIDYLASHLGINFSRVELGQLYIQQHHQDLVRLSSVNRMTSVMRELDLNRVLIGLTELVLSTVSGSAACLVLRCPTAGKLKTTTELGVTQNELDSLTHKEYGSISNFVTEIQQVWLTNEPREIDDFLHSAFLERLSSFLILPLQTCNGSGCLFVADPENVETGTLEIAQTITQLSRISIDNAFLHSQVVAEAIHKQQLQIAGKVQNSLMPASAPETDGVMVFGINLPCDDSSGDYFDFIELPDKRLCFVLADATGHGIGAAILATNARAMLRALLHNQPDSFDLASICVVLNNLMDADLAEDKFITMFIGLYNPMDQTLVYASAGHDPPLLFYEPETARFTELQGTGLPFGMFGNMNYEKSSPLYLPSGSVLILSSDGVPEAVNSAEQMYGMDRLMSMIKSNADMEPADLCRSIIDDVVAFRELAPQTDDITLVGLRVI